MTARGVPLGRSPSRAGRLDPQVEKRFLYGAREASRFFMNKSNVHRALERLVDRLTELEIPYAIVGALSLNAYGYQRTTSDVARIRSFVSGSVV